MKDTVNKSLAARLVAESLWHALLDAGYSASIEAEIDERPPTESYHVSVRLYDLIANATLINLVALGEEHGYSMQLSLSGPGQLVFLANPQVPVAQERMHEGYIAND